MIFHRFLFLMYFFISVTGDYYDLLGIGKYAKTSEIRKAFKKLALIYHPDKNKGNDALEKFIAINKAYEVLKDEEMRKIYDLYGEEGLKDNFFGHSQNTNFHNWNSPHESFGIYDDDDPVIVTLSQSEFETSVLDSPEIWFVNYYSPKCSGCHSLAPSFRKMAHDLQDVIQIGAVNCEEDWVLCKQQNIYSYPSLILYAFSQKTNYIGSQDAEDLVNFVLGKLTYNVIRLTSANYKDEISVRQTRPLPWLIFSCEGSGCVSKSDLKKLGIILEHLVYIAEIDRHDNKHACELLFCESPITYFFNLTTTTDKKDLQKILIENLEISEIVNKVLHLLPDLQEVSSQKLEEIRSESQDGFTWLILFTREETSVEETIPLKCLKYILPEIYFGHFICFATSGECSSLYLHKFPSYIMFRPDGSYEFYYGKNTVHDISRFAQEALKSQVHTLNPEDFPKVTQSEQAWFIDFFAYWCPPCLKFLTMYQKVSQKYGQKVKFGTVDCSIHRSLCLKYNIKSYPSAILYKNAIGHKYDGLHNAKELEEFIQDILNSSVVSLSPSSFEEVVSNKNFDELWVIDFFAPWCRPCQQLSPQWRKLSNMLKPFPYVHVGEVDCAAYRSFCSSLGVKGYPTIRLFPKGYYSSGGFFLYSGMSRDASSLQAWVYRYLPTNVSALSDTDFENMLMDRKPWVIDFFTPWCGHCQMFAPEFEKIAQKMKGKVMAGKVNCQDFSRTCSSASITAYPTVVFYKGQTGSEPQSPIGEEVNPWSFDEVISFIEKKLSELKVMLSKDEL